MSESLIAETQHWQSRCDEMQVTIDRFREERDELRTDKEALSVAYTLALDEVLQLKSMISRIQIAMSQGQEL